MNIRTKLLKLLGRKKASRITSASPKPTASLEWDTSTVPLHPPEPDQYSAVHYSQLLSKHKSLITLIRQEFGLSDQRFETEVMPIIEHAAKQLHLLPSSKEHHHHTPGGAFHHSLETASFCLRRSQTLNFNNRYPPYLHDEINENIKLALFIAGLWHDMGKPATDLTVKINDEAWSPFHEPLFDFLIRHQVSSYQIEWKSNRSTDLHNQMTPQFFGLFMSRLKIKLHPDIHGFLTSHYSGSKNPFSSIIRKSDQDSTDKDLIAVGTALQRPPISTTIIDSIRSLVHEVQEYELNSQSRKLILLADGLYLKYPDGLHDARERLKEHKNIYPSVPSEPIRILQKLFESGYIRIINESEEPSSELRYLKTIIINSSNNTISESSSRDYIKFSHPFLILDKIDAPLMDIDQDTGEIKPLINTTSNYKRRSEKKELERAERPRKQACLKTEAVKTPNTPEQTTSDQENQQSYSDSLSYVPDTFRPNADDLESNLCKSKPLPGAKSDNDNQGRKSGDLIGDFRLDQLNEIGFKFIQFLNEDMDLEKISDEIPKVNFTSSRVKSFRETHDISLTAREITNELYSLGIITKKSYTNSYVQLTPSFANYLKRETIHGTKN